MGLQRVRHDLAAEQQLTQPFIVLTGNLFYFPKWQQLEANGDWFYQTTCEALGSSLHSLNLNASSLKWENKEKICLRYPQLPDVWHLQLEDVYSVQKCTLSLSTWEVIIPAVLAYYFILVREKGTWVEMFQHPIFLLTSLNAWWPSSACYNLCHVGLGCQPVRRRQWKTVLASIRRWPPIMIWPWWQGSVLGLFSDVNVPLRESPWKV